MAETPAARSLNLLKRLRALRRDDVMLAALGVTLTLICALFPWYIFLNPEKFGPPEVTLDSGAAGSPRTGMGGQGQLGTGVALGAPPARVAPDALALLAPRAPPRGPTHNSRKLSCKP